jgi:hypothetical protein
MKLPEIYADFNNLDDDGRIRLTTVGSITDIARLGIQLRDGLELVLATDDADDAGNRDDVLADAVIRYNEVDKCWVAQVNWDEVKNRSQREAEAARSSNGTARTAKKKREAR